MNDHKFCSRCGAKMKWAEGETFDKKTGKITRVWTCKDFPRGIQVIGLYFVSHDYILEGADHEA